MRRRGAVAALCVVGLLMSSCGGDEGSVEEFCSVARSSTVDATVFAGFDPSDTDRAVQQLTDARLTLGKFRSAAPDEVRDAVDVEIAYVQALIDGLTALDDPDPARSVELVRSITAEHPDVEAAATELTAFHAEHCV